MTDGPVQPSWQYQHDMQVWIAQRGPYAAHIQAVSAFASLAINSVILSNGAAAVAVLALLGAIWKDDHAALAVLIPSARGALIYFAFGTFVAMLSAGLSYAAQWCFMQIEVGKDRDLSTQICNWVGHECQVVAFCFGLAGILSFGLGAWDGLDMLSQV